MADFNTGQMYETLMGKINEIDTFIDSAEGSATSGKRAFRKSLVEAHGEEFTASAESMVEKLKLLSVEKLVAAVTVITKALSVFDEQIAAYIDANTPEVPEGPKVSDEKLAELYTARKALVEQITQVIAITKTFGEDVSGMELPKRRNRSTGARGPQVISTYTYLVFDAEGEPVEIDEDASSLNDIAKTYGFANGRALRALFKTDAVWRNAEGEECVGIDTSNPPLTFTVALNDDFQLVGRRPVIESAEAE